MGSYGYLKKANYITRTSKTWVSDNIIFVTMFDNIVMDLGDAEENLEILKKLSPFLDVKYAYGLLIDLHGLKSVSRDAVDLFISAGKKESSSAAALAMIVKSPLTSLIGNFIMNFKTLEKPTRLFTTKEEAIKWLKMTIQTSKEAFAEKI